MRANVLRDGHGNVYAFDVRLSRRRAMAVVRALPDVSLIDTPMDARAPEPFCRFEVKGRFFKLYELDGHVRRVVVEPERPSDLDALDGVRSGFESAHSRRPWVVSALVAAAIAVAAAILMLREG